MQQTSKKYGTHFPVSNKMPTIGRACGFNSVSWFSHSLAISAATKRLFSGNSNVCPDGVFSGRLSNVTAIPSVLVSMPTVVQKRFSVFSAPSNGLEHRLPSKLITYGWFLKLLGFLVLWRYSFEGKILAWASKLEERFEKRGWAESNNGTCSSVTVQNAKNQSARDSFK